MLNDEKKDIRQSISIEPFSTEPQTNESRTTARPHYFIQLKSKQKIRKITSLINIKNEDSKRRPGFIRSNASKQHTSYSTNTSQNKQVNNERILRRTSSKEKIESVDKQILESKQRIARIRK